MESPAIIVGWQIKIKKIDLRFSTTAHDLKELFHRMLLFFLEKAQNFVFVCVRSEHNVPVVALTLVNPSSYT